MKHAENESFRKSFFVFFISLSLLAGLLSYFQYLKEKQTLESSLFNQMKLCSLDLKCTQFEFDFVPLQSNNLYTLSSDSKGLYALFSIPRNETYALKLLFTQQQYNDKLREIQINIGQYYLIALVIIAILSVLFSLYALYPLRRALKLTEEFSRDILHDLNTPVSSLQLNVSRLNVAPSEAKKLQRIEHSIQTIASLGNNLRSYLDGHELQQERIDLSPLLHERSEQMRRLYPDITFTLSGTSISLRSNRDALIRILDNLLSNAAKYNHPHGNVWIEITHGHILSIRDNGKGIKAPSLIFERFYKEHDRGLGIGLHIVKKLCDALNITIKVESEMGKGSCFTLDLAPLMDR